MRSLYALSRPEDQDRRRTAYEQTIRAELAWSDTATALGIVAHNSSPLIALCRKLVEAGHDPATPLEAWRASTFCVRVRSIGETAELAVNSKGTSFIKAARTVRTGPPVRANAGGVS
jgi:hypothetical protein